MNKTTVDDVAGNIGRDMERFNKILRGQAKSDFKKYIVNREWIIPKGKDKFALPIKRIMTPRFVYDQENIGGVGQGKGDKGQDLPGDESAEHNLELEVALEELAKMLCEALELPNLQNKGKQQLPFLSQKYKGIRRIGPSSLVNFKRSYKEALKREIGSGIYVPGMPVEVRPPDKRYKAPEIVQKPNPRAVVIYSMDVSGSMTAERKELVRTENFWIDTYLRSQYKLVESKYIVHDTTAKEVDKDTFYTISSKGGTKISSSFELSDKIIEDQYPPDEWNIYIFQSSDGENWDTGDNRKCSVWLKKMLQYINQYAYTEVGDQGSFKKWLEQEFNGDEKVVLANLNNKSGIIAVLKLFLGKGN